MKVELINYTKNPVGAIETAASTCYDSQTTADGRIMRHCYKSGHHAVLFAREHLQHPKGVCAVLGFS